MQGNANDSRLLILVARYGDLVSEQNNCYSHFQSFNVFGIQISEFVSPVT